MSQNVLLVDDDPDLTASLGRAFTRRGFKVYISHSTEHALRAAPRFKPDFAVVDLRMDGASGLDCLAGLHALSSKNADCRPDRLRQHCDGGECHSVGRLSLSGQTRRGK
ncbi:response regulator [Asticcacaulis sp. MM231]|uniref:response regulator n=1 Tax=Asticcacaulis sp. MM231 TaxID=3157666 RepID=UPI0032D59DBB